MGVQSQSLKATITFGGNIDSSWTQSTNNLNKNIKVVEKQSAQLAKQQKDLADKMKQAKLAGKDISGLKKDYDGVTREIKKTSAAQEQLNRDLKRTQTLSKWAGKGIGFAKGTGGLAIGGTIAGAGLAVGTIGMVTNINKQTTEKADTAASYGVGIETYNAWAALASQSGVSGPNSFGDMLIKYKKTAGKYKAGNKSPVLEKSFSALGLGEGSMKGLDSLGQFDKIMGRAVEMKDQTKASFAVGSLLGPEAAKILNTARAMGKSWDDIISDQKRYNLTTQKGANGAARNTLAMDKLSEVFTSSVAEVAGQLGDKLSPKIEEMTNKLAGWLKNGGIDEITSVAMNTWLPRMLAFGEGVVFVGKVIYGVAEKLSWLVPTQQEKKVTILKAMAYGGEDNGRKAAENLGLGDWLEKQLKSNPNLKKETNQAYASTRGVIFNDDDAYDKRIKQLVGKPDESDSLLNFNFEAVVNKYTDKPKDSVKTSTAQGYPALSELLAGVESIISNKSAEVVDNSNKYLTQYIYGAPGQDERQLAEEAIKSAKASNVFAGNNAMYDKPRL